MNLYRQFKTDEQKEVDGVWIALSATARVKVARMGNTRYRECMKRLRAPYQQGGLGTTIPDDLQQALLREAVAETILVDWDGIEDQDGHPLPYSKKAALDACTDLKDFYLVVLAASDNMETFKVSTQAALEKN